MLHRNAKSERILTKLRALNSEYIWYKNKFYYKILINIEVIIFKYRSRVMEMYTCGYFSAGHIAGTNSSQCYAEQR